MRHFQTMVEQHLRWNDHGKIDRNHANGDQNHDGRSRDVRGGRDGRANTMEYRSEQRNRGSHRTVQKGHWRCHRHNDLNMMSLGC